MSRRKQSECNHDRLNEVIEEHKQRGRRFEEGVERLLEPHKPYPEDDALRPGNSPLEVRFYCVVCRTAWPCRVFNDLRALYGEVNGWEPASQPYERLVLHRADPRPAAGGDDG